MRFDKNRQWVGAVYAEDIYLIRNMLDEDSTLANSLHVEFDDPYRSERYPVSTVLFAVAGPPPQQLDWRMVERKTNLALIQILLDSGADPNIECGHERSISLVRDEVIARYLVDRGADLNLWSDHGGSPLFFSIWNYDPERLRMQLKLGADPHQCDPRTGETALHIAALMTPEWSEDYAGLEEATQLLLEAGVDPNTRTKVGGPPLSGDTPLHLAAGYGTKEIIKLLLDSGAEKTSVNAVGDTPIDYAAVRGRSDDVLKLLR